MAGRPHGAAKARKPAIAVPRESACDELPPFGKPGVEAFGLTKPANTVGGDFYDILPRPDGTVMVALGDVAGKASPAALLMALLLAMLRTLVDEELPLPVLVQRLNLQVTRHAPASRFITLFLSSYNPATGRLLFVNAGQTPPLLRRQNGSIERLMSGGVALGMFAGSTYDAGEVQLHPGDALLLYSDGITEAENPAGQPFEEAGLERLVAARGSDSPAVLAPAILQAVEGHARDSRFTDDLTVLILKRA